MDQRTSDSDRMEESVRHALRLVGPGDRALETISEDKSPERSAAA